MLATAVLALAAVGCGDDEAPRRLHGSPLDPPFTVSATQLVDTEGDPYSLTADTDRPLTLVFFGYTRCADVCPAVMANLASAVKRLDASDREQVEVVFVTTDPERDTGPVLRDYLDRFDPSFVGVTGEITDIAEVAKSLAVGVGERLPNGRYEVEIHSTHVSAIDSDDQAPLYWGKETSSAQFADDIHTLLEDAS